MWCRVLILLKHMTTKRLHHKYLLLVTMTQLLCVETTNFGSRLTATDNTTVMYFDLNVARKDIVFLRYKGYTDGQTWTLYGSNDSTDVTSWVQIYQDTH